jgi:hypothetical protein
MTDETNRKLGERTMLRLQPPSPTTGPLTVILLLTLAAVPAHAKRHDVVVMKNGDQLSGEVKKLENGVLYLDTDYVSGSIQLDWLQVEKVQSTGHFQIVLKSGEHLAGSIGKVSAGEAPGSDFEVHAGERVRHTAGTDVINMESQKPNFWRQLTGAIDFGYDFTSGNSQTSFSSDASASYTATKWTAGASFTSSFSGQSGGSTTNLAEIQAFAQRYLSRNSFLMGLGDFLHSSQQGLALRSTLGGGFGRYWVRTSQNQLLWVAGTVYTHENFLPKAGQPNDQNVEGLLGIQYQLLRFDRYSLQSQGFLFPGLSDAGRIRATTKTIFSVKLSNNFHTNLSFWDNYDSRPPVNAKGNELGISSGLGWSF